MSVRDAAGSLYRRFEAVDPTDLVVRLTLVAILVSDHVAGYEWYLKSASRALAIAGILLPWLGRHWGLWGLLSLVFVLRTLQDWWFQDNHLFVFTYWCLTLFLALRLAQPGPALATSARLLIGLSFGLATLWKALLSPDYLDGTYFHHTLLADVRFRDLTTIVGRVSAGDHQTNLEKLGLLGPWRPDVPAVSLATTSLTRGLALVLTWWTLLIEALLALCFLWPRTGGPRRWRNPVLLLFGWTTYTVATVPTFGWTLLTLGAAQCEPSERPWRLLYAVTCIVVLLYSYAEILSLLRPWLPEPG